MPTSDFGVARPLEGYPSLSEDIASDPDRTSLVFRRFDKLAVRNLLYLQSELVELEAMQVRTRPVRILQDDLLISYANRNSWIAKIEAMRIMIWLPEDVL